MCAMRASQWGCRALLFQDARRDYVLLLLFRGGLRTEASILHWHISCFLLVVFRLVGFCALLFVVMARGFAFVVACALCRGASGVAQQAGDPVVLNIDYDVPSLGAEAVAAIVQHSAALEAKLTKQSENSKAGHGSGFSALGLSRDGVPPDDAEIVLHVAAPSVGVAQGASLASHALSQLASLSGVAQRQQSQELRALRGARSLFKRSASFVSDDASRAGGFVHKAPVATAAPADGSGRRIAELVSEVNAGGRVAKAALEQLLALASDPSLRAVVASSGAPREAATLLQRQSTDEAVRASAGSLLTLLSGMPFAAATSDAATGAGDHVEVVLPRPSRIYGPDAVAMQLSAGVPPSAISP